MDKIDIRKLDFALLQVFVELVRRRKATDVAAHLGVTQSTVSHALSRLRELFGDELFIRRPNGLEPTARALDLEPSARALLEAGGRLLGPAGSFDPAAASGTVRLGASDYNCSLFVPDLVARVRELAPGLVLSVRPLVRREAAEALASGELDLAIGFFWGRMPGLVVETLFDETYAVVARHGHPALDEGRLTLAAYTQAEHALVSYDGDVRGIVDEALASMGRSRRVTATVPFFFSALAIVARTDLLVTVPRRLAEAHAPRLGLVLAQPPLRIRPFRIAQAWHKRSEASDMRAWMSGQVRAVAGV
ncbi:LysR substrate-binding domain-containing protein [Nostoc sp. NIES-2111]